MSWTAPRTWATGEVVTAANLNLYISNNLSFLGSTAVATVATSQTTTSVTFTDLGTVGPATGGLTTLTKALVVLTAGIQCGAAASDQGIMGVAVSGTTTIAAADASALQVQTVSATQSTQQVSAAVVISGLTPGTNNIFTAKYRVNAGTGTFVNRTITVEPLTV